MKANLSRILFALLIVLPGLAQAGGIYTCDSSCSGIYSEASKLSRMLPRGTEYSVVDVETWAVATYVAEQRYSRAAGEYIEYPRKVATPASVISAINQVKAAQAEVENLKVEVPASVARNAHSVVESSQERNQVSRYVGNDIGIFTRISGLVGTLLEVFGKIIETDTVVEVEFEDGSTAKFILTYVTLSDDAIPEIEFQFEFLEGSAVDSDGNNIPSSPEEVVGSRRFGSELNQDLFRGVGELYGVEFRYGGCRNVNTTICVIDGSGYSCTTFTVCF